jgi:hypothetical protein
MSVKTASGHLKSISGPAPEPAGEDSPTHLLVELIKAAQLAGARFSVQVTLCNAEHPDQHVLVDASGQRLFWHPGKYPRSMPVPADKARSVDALTAFLVEVLQSYDELPPQLGSDPP